MDDPDFNPDLEGDLLGEDISGKPLNYRSTARAIARLEKRILYLRGLLDKAVSATPAGILADLRKAEADLAGYRRQHDARN